jgi:hypothetical protein
VPRIGKMARGNLGETEDEVGESTKSKILNSKGRGYWRLFFRFLEAEHLNLETFPSFRI